MLIFKRIEDLQRMLSYERAQGRFIGFIPTMGALHKGHLSLFEKSRSMADLTVGTIFVNPTQFNEKKDLEKYPRTPEKDIEMLVGAGCGVLFMPPVTEVYPNGEEEGHRFDFGYLDKPMEGANRPGHFGGMAQVINRFVDIIGPDHMFMGQKDFQQFAIVKDMLKQLGSGVNLVMCPIVREEDGLAMSSRNARLSKEQRRMAPNIYRVLNMAKEKIHSFFPQQIQEEAMQMLRAPGMEPEYFEIVDGTTLQQLELFENVEVAVACTAVRVGEIRLIDNLILKGMD